jgi:hypothetical protein
MIGIFCEHAVYQDYLKENWSYKITPQLLDISLLLYSKDRTFKLKFKLGMFSSSPGRSRPLSKQNREQRMSCCVSDYSKRRQIRRMASCCCREKRKPLNSNV